MNIRKYSRVQALCLEDQRFRAQRRRCVHASSLLLPLLLALCLGLLLAPPNPLQ